MSEGVQLERTLVLIKPDAVKRRLIGRILQRFEDKGLKIVAMKMLWLDRQLAQQHYAVHKDKPFFESLVQFITSGPLVALVLEGPDAIQQVRTMLGATDCKRAAPGTIRFDYGLSVQYNMVHASDSPETAQREIAIFFSQKEIYSYKLPTEDLIY